MNKPNRTVWLNATVFLTGAGIMTVELVASRLSARYLGSSLYTWTGVLSVILAGLSLGNYLGGRMADAARNLPQRIAAMCFAGATACLAILWLNVWAGASPLLLGRSWPMRIMLHMTWAFLAPAVVLGTISPMVAKLALERSTHTGRTIGAIYACGTVGSIVGTLATGFYLSAWMGSVRIIVGMALLLALLGLCYAVSSRRAGAPLAVPAAAVVLTAVFGVLFLLAVLPGEGVASVAGTLRLRDGPIEPDAVYFAETQYQIITVTAEPGHPAHRKFFQDTLLHSEVDISDLGDLKYPYMRIYDALLNRVAGRGNRPVRLLMLGGGGYVFPNVLFRARPGSEIVVVEIDPGVTRAAREAFGLPADAPIEIHHMDARNYVADALRRNRENPGSVPPFDFIMCDSVSDFSVPYQLTTREFMEQVRQLLAPGGLYAMNLIDAYEIGAFMNAVGQTLFSVFPHVGAVSAAENLDARNTFVFVGANEEIDLSDLADWTTRPGVFRGFTLDEAHFADLRARNGEAILTDDWAPVENLLAPVVRIDRQGELTAHLRAGIRAAKREDYPRAILQFRRALDVSPLSEDAWRNLAQAQELAQDSSGALDSYAALVQIHPGNVHARNRAALILARRGHVGPALEQWTESLRINPAQPDVLNNLGALAMQAGQPDVAVGYWRQALDLAPDSPILRQNLAAVEADLRRAPVPEPQER